MGGEIAMKMNRTLWIKVLSAVPLCLILYCFNLIPGSQAGESLTDVFTKTIFGKLDYQYSYVYAMAAENVAFILLFDILFAGHLTGHFRYSCVYVFTRIRSRRLWYFSRIGELTVCALLYSFLYVLCSLLVSINATQKLPDGLLLQRVALVFLFAFALVLASAVSVNLLALRFGTAVGFFSVAAVIFGLIALLILTYRNRVLVMFNPLACLNLFQLGRNTGMFTIGYDLLILIAVVLIGSVIVNRYDVALFDPELN